MHRSPRGSSRAAREKSSQLHESLAVRQSKTTLGRVTSDGWTLAWRNASHRRLKRAGWNNYTFAFHDADEVGPGLLAQIAKKTGLKPEDL
ncbi:MAG: type II toxin-antitoxin system HicA family toxin [Bryobacteraceae bacterium]